MLSERVELVDVDPEHWLNLFKLIRAGRARAPQSPANSPPADLLLFMDGARCRKARHSERGVISDYQPGDLADLAAAAEQEGVGRLTVIEKGAFRRIMHRAQAGLSLDQNYLEQGFLVYGAIREEMGKGIRLHPRPRLPDIKYSAASTMIKMICPPGEMIALVIWADDGQTRDSSGQPIFTSIIIRLDRKSEINLITTTDSLVPSGLAVSDWRSDYRRVNDLAKKVWNSPLFLGVHIPVSALAELAAAAGRKEGPKALLALNKAGRIILDPFPLRLKALLTMGGAFKF